MKTVEKIKSGIKENKSYLIIMVVLWIILSIVLVAPIAHTYVDSILPNGKFNLTNFIQEIVTNIVSFSSIFKVFSEQYIKTFLNILLIYTIFFLFCAILGFLKSKTHGDYYDIEHGSSDWSEKGEQYRVLSKDSGIILAEDNYLPLTKRGNLNTLIVGRFRFW